jgi:hypothetical protein
MHARRVRLSEKPLKEEKGYEAAAEKATAYYYALATCRTVMS